jgi:hypothetical protein
MLFVLPSALIPMHCNFPLSTFNYPLSILPNKHHPIHINRLNIRRIYASGSSEPDIVLVVQVVGSQVIQVVFVAWSVFDIYYQLFEGFACLFIIYTCGECYAFVLDILAPDVCIYMPLTRSNQTSKPQELD